MPQLSGIFAADVQVYRFYADGTVLSVLIKPAPGPESGERIAGWLRREEPVNGVRVAAYRLRRHQISFGYPSHLGGRSVQVEGVWSGRRLRLDIRDGGSQQRDVHFVRIWP